MGVRMQYDNLPRISSYDDDMADRTCTADYIEQPLNSPPLPDVVMRCRERLEQRLAAAKAARREAQSDCIYWATRQNNDVVRAKLAYWRGRCDAADKEIYSIKGELRVLRMNDQGLLPPSQAVAEQCGPQQDERDAAAKINRNIELAQRHAHVKQQVAQSEAREAIEQRKAQVIDNAIRFTPEYDPHGRIGWLGNR